jgi:hypothetical protein
MMVREKKMTDGTKKWMLLRWRMLLLVLVFTVFFRTIVRYEISLLAVSASDRKGTEDSIFQKPVIHSNQESSSSNDDAGVGGIASFFEQSHFVYGNKTYAYRYSPKLIAKMKQAIETQQQHRQQQKQQLPMLLFGVCSNPKKLEQRQAIRESWAQDAAAAVVLFMVAGDWDDEVAEEFQQQGDLLWIDGPEHYRKGLTPKSLGFLHFASTQVYQRHHLPFDYIFKRTMMSTSMPPTLVSNYWRNNNNNNRSTLTIMGWSKRERKQCAGRRGIGRNFICLQKTTLMMSFQTMLPVSAMPCPETLPIVPQRTSRPC